MTTELAFLGPHGGFILASYAAAALILGAMIGFSLLAHRSAARALAEIERRDG